MSKTIGRIIGTAAPLALMTWAAIETTGALHWALVGWLIFSALVFICYTAIRADRD